MKFVINASNLKNMTIISLTSSAQLCMSLSTMMKTVFIILDSQIKKKISLKIKEFK
jgi:hypothetical protein